MRHRVSIGLSGRSHLASANSGRLKIMSVMLPLKKMSAEEMIQVMESIRFDLCDASGSRRSPVRSAISLRGLRQGL